MAGSDGTDEGPRRRPILLLVVVLVVAVGFFASSGSRGQVVVLEVPPQDHVEARTLADGTPVFVTSNGGGEVAVIEAFTIGPGPIGGVVGWCGPGMRFVDPQLGLSFDASGRRLIGRVPARVDRTRDTTIGLVAHEVEAGGQAQAGDPLRVAAALDPPTEAVDPPLGGEQGHGPPISCRLPSTRVGEGADPSNLDGVGDHGDLATRLRPALDGWQIVAGWIHVAPSGDLSWCDGFINDRVLSACNDARGVPVAIDLAPTAAGDVVTVLGSPIAVRVRDGRIMQAAVLPRSTWAGSSLIQTVTHRLTFVGVDLAGSRLLVVDAGGEQCTSPAPPTSGAPAGTDAIYVDIDTRVDVRGATDLQALRGVRHSADVRLAVDAVFDTVTCRVLVVRDTNGR